MLLAIAAAFVPAAYATSDSWVMLAYPLTDMYEEGNKCEGYTIALDPVSSGPHATARLIAGVLNNPINVPNPIGHAASPTDANAITDGAKAALTVTFAVDDDGASVARGTLALDATALSAANGLEVDGRTDTLRRTKQLIAFSLRNFMRRHNKAAVMVTIAGLPSQEGLPGMKLVSALQSPVSSRSQWLADLARELKPKGPCPSL